jgi:ribosomal protein L14E/L6E/L27E
MLKAPIDTNLAGGAGDIVVVPVPVVTFFNPGEIVRVSSGKFAGVYVVINDPGRDNVSIAKLGGDGGRYVRMARRALTKVDPADVLA